MQNCSLFRLPAGVGAQSAGFGSQMDNDGKLNRGTTEQEIRATKTGKPAQVFILTNGCDECRLETAEAEQLLIHGNSYTVCQDYRDADLIVFLTCAFNQSKEDLSRRIMQKIDAQKRPDAQLLPLGCLTRVIPETARPAGQFADLVATIDRLTRFGEFSCPGINQPYPEIWNVAHKLFGRETGDAMLCEYVIGVPMGSRLRLMTALSASLVRFMANYRRFVDKEFAFDKKRTFSIRISTGCRGRCSYCSIRISRGDVKSKPLEMVIAEFERGLAAGYRDFALLGTDIGDYGKDQGSDLINLLEAMVAHKEDFKLRLHNLNPRWLIASAPRFDKVLKTGKIAYLLSPIESLSDRVLEKMARGYGAQDYMAAAHQVRRADSRVYFSTQIMVGFPGETEEDFQKSAEVFKPNLFDYVEIYRFTPRSGTRAAKMADQVPVNIGRQRYRQLLFRSLFVEPVRRRIRRMVGMQSCPPVTERDCPGIASRRETRGEELIAHR